MQCMPIALHQLPDDIDALKSLVAEQLARNEQLTTENQRYKVQVLTLTEQLNLAHLKRAFSSGFCMWQKRLEKARFKWPRKVESEVITLSGQQLNWLLDGYDVMRFKPHERLHFSSVL